MESGIEIKNLSKKYDSSDVFALKDLTLSVRPGEVYGFLGPNGAGKSTTIRILMNFLQPTSGSATILGKDIVNDNVAIKHSVGYLSGDFAVYPKMNGKQYLKYLGELHHSNGSSYAQDLASRLKADLSKPLGELSRGNRQKIGLIQALMHKPKVLILDEPSSGLDPLMQEEFYKLIGDAKQAGTTVFVSSHILSEVQKLCDRVGIIREGELIAERNIKEMTTDAAHTFDIIFDKAAPCAALKKVKGVKLIKHNGPEATINIQGELAPLFLELAKHTVLKIDARNLDLEEVFLHYYQEAKK